MIQECCLRHGIFKCPHCLQCFCSQHTSHPSYECRLNITTGMYDPTGQWARVCQSCYEQRPGQDDPGTMRYRFEDFDNIRINWHHQRDLYRYKLEQRLERLMDWDDVQEDNIRTYEQQCVQWQPDLPQCAKCKRSRSLGNSKIFFPINIQDRQHHCRLCGESICGQCATKLPIRYPQVQKHAKTGTILVCKDCESLIQRRRYYLVPKVIPLAKEFRQFSFLKNEILQLVPRYQMLLEASRGHFVKDRDSNNPNHQEQHYWEAETTRTTIIQHLVAMKTLCNDVYPSAEERTDVKTDEQRLRQRLWLAGQLCIQRYLAPLQLFPKLEDLQSEDRDTNNNGEYVESQELNITNGHGGGAIDQGGGMVHRLIDKFNTRIRQSLQSLSTSSTDISGNNQEKGVLLANMKALLNQLQVLQDQELLLQQSILNISKDDDGNDEFLALREALEEVQQEIKLVQQSINYN